MERESHEAHIHSGRVRSIFQMSLYACLKICGFQFDQILFVCFSTSFLRIALVENIPEGLNYSENAPFHLSLFQGWMNLLNMAKKSVDIVSSHWDLNHSHPSACQVSCILCVCVCLIFLVCIVYSFLFVRLCLKFNRIFSACLYPQFMCIITFICM